MKCITNAYQNAIEPSDIEGNAIVMYVNHTIMIQMQCVLSLLDNILHRSYSDFSTIFVIIWPNRSLINRKNYKRDRGIVSAKSRGCCIDIFRNKQ